MIEPKFVEWMNMELDGVLPPRRQQKLREHLSAHPEAATYFEELRAAVGAVDALGQADPPAGLEERILGAVPFGRYQNDPRGHHHEDFGWREKWFSLPRFRYAAVFIFGIVFGVLVFSAMRYDTGRGGGGLDISDFWGTMRHITSADGFTQTRVIDVDLERVRGTVRLHESDRALLAEVDLDAPDEIEWVVEYHAGDVSLDGYRCFDDGGGEVVAATNEIRVQQSGDTRYVLLFTRKHHPVTPFIVKIFSADQLLLEKPLSPAAKSAKRQ